MCYMRNALTDSLIQNPLIFGIFADNIQSVCKYAKYEDTRCQANSHAIAPFVYFQKLHFLIELTEFYRKI